MKKKIELTFTCGNNELEKHDKSIRELLDECIEALNKFDVGLKSVTIAGNLFSASIHSSSSSRIDL